MSAPRFHSVCAMGLVGMVTLARAQEQKPLPAAPPPAFAIPGSPPEEHKATAVPKARKAAKRAGEGAISVATFPGFRLLPDGRSRVYVELTRPASFAERRGEGAIIYTLRGARVLVRNNRNSLITTHFPTPVARARLLSVGRDLELVIDLRKAVSGTPQMVLADDGTARLEVEFPAGDYPLAPSLFGPPHPRTEPAAPAEENPDGTAAPPAPPVPSAAGAPPSQKPPTSPSP